MNGILNVIAALVLGGGIMGAGYYYSEGRNADTVSEERIAEIEERALADARAQVATSCDILPDLQASCAGDLASGEATSEADTDQRFSEVEEPYAPGVAAGSDQPTTASSQSYEAPVETAVLGASVDGREEITWRADQQATTSDGKPVDKKDTGAYFTEDQRMGTAPVDKPDSGQYFTENTRMDGKPVDKPDSGQYFTENQRMDGKPVDKPDTGNYFTENRRLDGKPVDKPDDSDFFTEEKRFTQKPDPCLNPDGTPYTGPGTAQDPFAPGDPCLAGVEEYQFTEDPQDPCEINPFTGERVVPYDPSTGLGDPCLTEQHFAEKPEPEPTPIPVPETPVSPPSEPVRTAQLDPGWTSPYQDIPTGLPIGPQPTIPPRDSDYPMH